MKTQSGLSLIELMIAMTLGLLVLAAVAVIFANTSNSRSKMEVANRQIENGRFASQLLTDDLHMAGYLAEFDPHLLTLPVTLPDPCATSMADLAYALPLHVQGINNVTVAPTCISDLKAGTDILVIRRASSCVAGSSNCDAFEEGAPHFQASLCDGPTELSHPIRISNPCSIDPNDSNILDYKTSYFALSTNSADLTRRKNNCTSAADIYRYNVHIYFIANNNEAGDGIPTLKRAELGANGFTIVPMVDGINDMQIEYGVDIQCNWSNVCIKPVFPLNCDGIPDDVLVEDPATASSWFNVMAARVHLQSGGKVFSNTIRLINPAGRRP